MIRIVTLSESKDGVDNTDRLRELTEQLRLAEIDVLCCQGMQRTLDGKKDPVGKIAELLEMTYSFSTTGYTANTRGEGEEITIKGLSILAGAHVWMLNSGSFVLPDAEPDRKQVAQYALIRENCNVFLVINLELSPVAAVQLEQLRTVFCHQLLQEHYDAVILCSSGKNAVSISDVQTLTALSAYTLTSEISGTSSLGARLAPLGSSLTAGQSGPLTEGMIFTFTTRKPAPFAINLQGSSVTFQPAAGLAAEFEFKRIPLEKRPKEEKRGKFLFPLSFSEQRSEIRESFRGLALSTP